MVLVSETEVLRIIQQGPMEGISNVNISREILRQNECEASELGSIKVMVSRKTKQLVEQGEVVKIGRRLVITVKGSARLGTRSLIRSNFAWSQRTFQNIHVSFASPPNPTRIISERRDVVEALETLDKLLGDEEDASLIIRRKKVSRETP